MLDKSSDVVLLELGHVVKYYSGALLVVRTSTVHADVITGNKVLGAIRSLVRHI